MLSFGIGDRPRGGERRKSTATRSRLTRHDRVVLVIAAVCVGLLLFEALAIFVLQRR